ncbi:type II toxin-antitoxin system RelE/ParE family toxin [Thiomicrorhabdus indica]|uniref:type II toxin-antitoxin system RelE family toxin n=1 Tax=Thiomicrorhabdus indica TaxID=2267253 RepID=UPI002AA6BB0B|nr:type II toxin-antitoxin system RelE/ParE family toxin [Thiomicrorhabdus indica]
MNYNIVFDDKVIKDLKAIDTPWQKKILRAIQEKLSENPFIGKKLVGDLSSFYRLRVGDYRVIYEIVEDELIIVVIKIRHRKSVYR